MLDDKKEEDKEVNTANEEKSEPEGVPKDEQALNFNDAKSADNASETSNGSVRRRRGKAVKSAAS